MSAEFTPGIQVHEFSVTEAGLNLQTQDSSSERLVFKPGMDVHLIDWLILSIVYVMYAFHRSPSACAC